VDIREKLAKIGVKYVYAVEKQQKEYKRYKTQENEARLYIYRLMQEMLEKISQEPNKEVYISYGKRIKTMAIETKVSVADVVKDLKEINRLLDSNMDKN
jgi:hypothetical protein